MRSLAAVIRVHERQLRECEDTILVALGRQPRMYLRQRFLRILVKSFVQIQIHQLAHGKRARPFSGKHIRGKRVIGDPRFHIPDPDRGGTARANERDGQRYQSEGAK